MSVLVTNAVTGQRDPRALADALTYATMLYDAAGLTAEITTLDGTPIPLRFTERGQAVAA